MDHVPAHDIDEISPDDLLDMELALARGGMSPAQQRRALEFIRAVMETVDG